MAYPIPKISYDPGSGLVTFSPTYPPVQKPVFDLLAATRHDSFTSSGLRQSMLERVDTLKTVMMESVPWSEVQIWQDFLAYAIQGGSFLYYPDATATAYQTWELVDAKFDPKFGFIGFSKFSLQLRMVPGGASSA